MLVIGLDVHKDSVAAVAVDHAGRQVDSGTFDNTEDGHTSLLAWANAHGARLRVGMEPSGGVARRLAHSLETAGHLVSEVQPRLSRGEAKRLRTRGKTDPSDALAIARVVPRRSSSARSAANSRMRLRRGLDRNTRKNRAFGCCSSQPARLRMHSQAVPINRKGY